MGDQNFKFVETCSLERLDKTISIKHAKYENYQGLKEKEKMVYGIFWIVFFK